jgi:hypothetical protein
MSDEKKDERRELVEVAYRAAIPQAVMNCPHCEKEFGINRKAFFEENSLTSVIHLKEGHYLQASTLGGHITTTGKLLKDAAKAMEMKIDVLVTDIHLENGQIKIKFTSVQAGKQPQMDHEKGSVISNGK